MELTQLNNSGNMNVNNLNFLRSQKVETTDLNSIQNKNSVDRVETSTSSASSLSLNVSAQISRVSSIQMVKSEVSNALKIANNFEQVITSNKNALDNVQPEIQGFISSYNNATKNLTSSMNKITEDVQNEDSRIYFDGILGAKPISGQEIYEAISKQKQNLEQYNKALNHQLDQATNQAKDMFANEKVQTQSTERSGKTIDFESESVTFEVKTIQNQGGSMVQTQAHAEPTTSKELLVAS